MTRDEEILGWIHVYVSLRLMIDPAGELGGLVVTENARNKGVGKRLLQKAEDWLMQQGCDMMIVRR